MRRDVGPRAMRPASRQTHLDDDGVRSPSENGIYCLRLPREPMQIADDNDHGLLLPRAKYRLEVDWTVIEIEPLHAHSAIGKRIRDAPWDATGGHRPRPAELHHDCFIADGHLAIAPDRAAGGLQADAIALRRHMWRSWAIREGIDTQGRFGETGLGQSPVLDRGHDRSR